jgi:hypothetical protein
MEDSYESQKDRATALFLDQFILQSLAINSKQKMDLLRVIASSCDLI